MSYISTKLIQTKSIRAAIPGTWNLFLFSFVSQPLFSHSVMQARLELWNLNAIWIQREPLLGLRVLYFQQIIGQTQKVSSKQSKIIYLKREEKGRAQRVHSANSSAASRVGILVTWCGLSDLSKYKIPIHVFCLFHESPHTTFWVDISFRV